MSGAEFLRNRNWYGHTTIHPIGLTALIVLALALLFVRRRHAVTPMLLAACFIAPAQRVIVFDLDFTVLRMLVTVGWLRLLIRGETSKFRWHVVDVVLIAYVCVMIATPTIVQASFDVFLNRCGLAFDAVGYYFLFRNLVRGWDDVLAFLRMAVWISVPVMCFLFVEHLTGRNLFSVLGGVPEMTFERQGRLRCQGAFAHAILAGTFWAVLLPPFLALAWRGTQRFKVLAAMGLFTTLWIVFFCASSTPVMALILVGVGMLAYPARNYMRPVRWTAFVLLTLLHFVMTAPIWHLISRINVVGGSTGYHRFALMDRAIKHFDEWWLHGGNSYGWGYGLQDTTNQYVVEGLRGGVLMLILFVAVLALCFRSVGALHRRVKNDRANSMLAWALGVSLFTQMVSFISISYFGQIWVVWYLLLAAIVSLDVTTRSAGKALPVAYRARRGPPRRARRAPPGGRGRPRHPRAGQVGNTPAPPAPPRSP